MAFSEAEARIRRLMARIQQAEYRAATVQDKILRTRQDIAGFYQTNFNQCMTTFEGSVVGAPGVSLPIPNSTVQIIGHVTGTDYGTFPATDGTYSIGIPLSVSDTSVDIVVTGPGVRFTASSATNVAGITRCGTKTVGSITAAPSSGYIYLSNSAVRGCNFPVNRTLKVTEPVHVGTGVTIANWPGGNFVCSQQTSNVTTACTTAITTAFYARFDITNFPSLLYPSIVSGGCPDPKACGAAAFAFSNALPLGGTVTKTCPDETTKFSMTYAVTVPANHLWYPAGPLSITYEEP
jgi:hypothetical protein